MRGRPSGSTTSQSSKQNGGLIVFALIPACSSKQTRFMVPRELLFKASTSFGQAYWERGVWDNTLPLTIAEFEDRRTLFHFCRLLHLGAFGCPGSDNVIDAQLIKEARKLVQFLTKWSCAELLALLGRRVLTSFTSGITTPVHAFVMGAMLDDTTLCARAIVKASELFLANGVARFDCADIGIHFWPYIGPEYLYALVKVSKLSDENQDPAYIENIFLWAFQKARVDLAHRNEVNYVST